MTLEKGNLMMYFKIKRVYCNGFSKQFYTKLKIDKVKCCKF